MQRILSLIDDMELSLSRYLDEKSKSKGCENNSSVLPQRVDKATLQNACATLKGKYEMLCQSVGICVLNWIEIENIGVSNIDIHINESESHRIGLSRDLFNRVNVVCNFYNMVNISASFRDAIVRLILAAYGDVIKGKVSGEDKINLNKVDSIRLSKILGESCLLGATMTNYITRSEEYKRIIDLRKYLVHHSVTDVLFTDYSYSTSKPKVVSFWTPTGSTMPLPDYAKFVYITSTDIVKRICKCIAEKAAECIEQDEKDSL